MYFSSSTLAIATTALLASVPFARAQEDCDIAAKFMPFATVDCNYVWENGNNQNFLNYVVSISGTGQRQAGWCRGIMNNIVGRCQLAQTSFKLITCDEGDERTIALGYDEPTNEQIEMFGIAMNIHMNTWTAGEDNRACVSEAIRDATCGSVSLDEYACYERPVDPMVER